MEEIEIENLSELESLADLDWEMIESILDCPPCIKDLAFASVFNASFVVLKTFRINEKPGGWDPSAYEVSHILSIVANNHSASLYDEGTREGLLVSLLMTSLKTYRDMNSGDGFPETAVMPFATDVGMVKLMYQHPRCAFKRDELTNRIVSQLISDARGIIDDPDEMIEDCTDMQSLLTDVLHGGGNKDIIEVLQTFVGERR